MAQQAASTSVVELKQRLLYHFIMDTTSPPPEQIFHSHLPVGSSLLMLFIPSKDRDGQSIDQIFWVDQCLTTLGIHFRGGTAYPRGRGVWRDDQRGGMLVIEEPVIIFSYVATTALTVTALQELYKTLSRMGRATNQGEVGVVLDGKYYGITEYLEE